jgi:hypothetical protein
MPDVKISELPAATTPPSATDVLVINQGTPTATTKKIAYSDLVPFKIASGSFTITGSAVNIGQATTISFPVTVQNAALGKPAIPSLSIAIPSQLAIWAACTAANTVTVYIRNENTFLVSIPVSTVISATVIY